MNQILQKGDESVATTPTARQGLSFLGPFSGRSINCSSCHLVDQHLSTEHAGMRAYNDFARRSKIPLRSDDDLKETPRNSPSLVHSRLFHQRSGILHFDGEFSSMEELVKGTLTGRNYGWLSHEKEIAKRHIAKVIRNDDGSLQLFDHMAVPYKEVLAGSAMIDGHQILPVEFQIDVNRA